MAKNDNQRLRELVNDYYHGLLTAESYRERRTQLLDNIGKPVELASDETIRDEKPRTAAPRKRVDDDTAELPKRMQKSGSSGLFIGAIAVAVVGLAVVLFVMRSPESPPEGGTTMPESAVPAAGNPGELILEGFLDQNDWSRDSLANLLIAWNALDDGQRNDATGSRPYRRFTSRLHQRIREEAALSSAATPSRNLQMMTDFAAGFGAPYRASASIPATVAAPAASTQAANVAEDDTPAVEAVRDDVPPDAIETVQQTIPAEPAPDIETAASEYDLNSDAPAAAAAVIATSPPVDEPPAESTPSANAAETSAPPVEAARPAPTDDACPARLANTRQPYCRDALASGDDGPLLVVLRPGAFDMGSEDNDREGPVRRVEIAAPIALARDEISVAEYRRFCTDTGASCPSAPWGGDDYPVVSVSWEDANAYAAWLSEQTGNTYRLPTEAEWEYAARAGTQTPYSFGDEVTPSSAHSSANGPVDAPLPRGDNDKINRNPFRLYHMSGNVREWVSDAWYDNYEGAPNDGSARTSAAATSRVVRGGSYADSAPSLRSAAREPIVQTNRDSETGFRVVREIYPATE